MQPSRDVYNTRSLSHILHGTSTTHAASHTSFTGRLQHTQPLTHPSRDVYNTRSLSHILHGTSATHAASHTSFTGPLQHMPLNGGGGGGWGGRQTRRDWGEQGVVGLCVWGCVCGGCMCERMCVCVHMHMCGCGGEWGTEWDMSCIMKSGCAVLLCSMYNTLSLTHSHRGIWHIRNAFIIIIITNEKENSLSHLKSSV